MTQSYRRSDYDDPDFYDLENDWGPDDAFYLDLARQGGSVLDLACGTGRLTRVMAAEGGAVTGVDVSMPMLDRARHLDTAGQVDWVAGDALGLQLGKYYDLVVMTGHGFQHFLSDTAQRAALAAVAAHLAPGGRFAFDVLNPAALTFTRRFEKLPTFTDQAGREIHGRIASVWDADSRVATHLLRRDRGDGAIIRSRVRLRYSRVEALDAMLTEAGFEIERRYGDWPDQAFQPASPEIITVCRRRARPG